MNDTHFIKSFNFFLRYYNGYIEITEKENVRVKRFSKCLSFLKLCDLFVFIY